MTLAALLIVAVIVLAHLLYLASCDLRRQRAEIARLRQQIEGHCHRIAAQSELLGKRAEKPAVRVELDEAGLAERIRQVLDEHGEELDSEVAYALMRLDESRG